MNEDKNLLLKYLCMALPYRLKVETPYADATLIGIVNRKGFRKDIEYIDVLTDKQKYPIKYIKPYLRPMSSMTDEEKKEYDHRLECMFYDTMYDDAFAIDWLNAHHFDYRGLIDKDLAIEVTNENNPYKL